MRLSKINKKRFSNIKYFLYRNGFRFGKYSKLFNEFVFFKEIKKDWIWYIHYSINDIKQYKFVVLHKNEPTCTLVLNVILQEELATKYEFYLHKIIKFIELMENFNDKLPK